MASQRQEAVSFLVVSFCFSFANTECTFRITSDLGKKAPLLLKPEGPMDTDRFVSPKRDTDILLFHDHQKLLLACPGKRNVFIVDGRKQQYSEITATCIAGNKFMLNGIATHMRNIICMKTPDSDIQETGTTGCLKSKTNKRLNIGFSLPTSHGFVPLIEVCYDPIQHATLYTKFKLVRGIKQGQSLRRNSYFRTEVFRDHLKTSFINVYKAQRMRVNNLVGKDIVNCRRKDSACLQKGHLAAFADFVYYAQKEATMYALNTVPEWKKVNVGNWKRLEEKIRTYASETDQDLTLYVGTYGVLKLHRGEKTVEVYLGNKTVPVPQLLYAIVYDKGLRHGIVFVAVNDVFENHQRICMDVCSRNRWFSKNWSDRLDFRKGYVYCCVPEHFVRRTGLLFPIRPLLV